jgi:hypothetical protein
MQFLRQAGARQWRFLQIYIFSGALPFSASFWRTVPAQLQAFQAPRLFLFEKLQIRSNFRQADAWCL